ncbi:hypothetical protein [Corynebacterium sp. NML180780]|uniref:hypothetical protein n=1 Tax=Corynebacterium sp. NML180780 TaxID=2598459 RepID=UPI00119435DA|nr:hypothetical protein [Corynebacterium sp. NML180780]TVX77408.1 hypothetical protein FPP74_09265 [Corynebacterium sp. NML180780]
MNRLLALGLTAALTLPLAACGGEQTWQVVAVHTDPAEPGALLADAAGLANFTITDSSLTGTTACADLDAAITTEDDAEDDAFTVDSVEVGDAADCDGGARHVHEQLTSIIVPGARFRVDHLTDSEMVFTATSDGPEGEPVVDPPSIRLMAL